MSSPPSGRFERALRIVGYNRRLYAAAAAVVVLGTVATMLPGVPDPLRWCGSIAAAVALWYAAASFLAFHWMFDWSELLGGRWLTGIRPDSPARWVQINAGLEETTLPLAERFPDAEGRTLDLFHPAVMTEPAIGRARESVASSSAALPVRADALPVADAWADLVVVVLVAHEIRDPAVRAQFFGELRRIVAPSGRVALVEHLRDVAAALAFGPGIGHFQPRSEWLRRSADARLEVERELRITPFVRVFVLRRSVDDRQDPR